MSGHSKWANIKHRKAKTDAQKAKVFTKLGRELSVAAKEGGGDPDGNIRLRMAIQHAREANMPGDNIQRAIQRGLGASGGASYESITYEGYAPGGVAVMLDLLTDNRNRTAAEMRHLFSRHGGSLGETGCVAWMFDRKGLIIIDNAGGRHSEDDLLLLAAEAGAEDVNVDDRTIEIQTSPEDVMQVRETLAAKGMEITSAQVAMIPKNTVGISGKTAEQVLRMVEAFEEHDDVQEVYANFDIDEAELEALA
ncbi:MAG: YebC/PmpR family DNA-binding transcriptional regulator [Firmicutes bacterium]|nr:YebC/PmpR family DNA-binding transcriptional regulator [Bacillota bacterium]